VLSSIVILVLWCHVVGIALAFLGCSAGRSGDNLETSSIALTVDPNAIYTIAGVASGECVQIAGLILANSHAPNSPRVRPRPASSFRFSQVAEAINNIVNAASGKCLDVQSKSTANGAAIIQLHVQPVVRINSGPSQPTRMALFD